MSVIKETINPDRTTLILNIEREGNYAANDGNVDGNDGNYDGNIGSNDGNRDGNTDGNLSATDRNIFSVIRKNNALSAKKIAEKLGVSESTVERATKRLKKLGYIERDGKTRGFWVILK